MKSKYVLFAYYIAIVILLVYAVKDAWQNNKKLISVLTAFVAVITTLFAINAIRRVNA